MNRDRRTRIGARAPGAESNPTPRRRIEESSARHRTGQPNLTMRCAKGRCKPGVAEVWQAVQKASRRDRRGILKRAGRRALFAILLRAVPLLGLLEVRALWVRCR